MEALYGTTVAGALGSLIPLLYKDPGMDQRPFHLEDSIILTNFRTTGGLGCSISWLHTECQGVLVTKDAGMHTSVYAL